MHNDPEWFIGRELSRPSDDEFLYIVVEILFAERKRIQAERAGRFFRSESRSHLRLSAVVHPCSAQIVNQRIATADPKHCRMCRYLYWLHAIIRYLIACSQYK